MASTASAAGAFTVTASAARHSAHHGRLASARATPATMRLIIDGVVVDAGDEDDEHRGIRHAGDHRFGGVDAASSGARATPHAHSTRPAMTANRHASTAIHGCPPATFANRPRKIDRSGPVDGGPGQIPRIDGRDPYRVAPEDMHRAGRAKPDAANFPWAT